MPDIFISYSRKDAAQATELAEKLRTAGMDVWIDRQGLEVSSQWSGEIVSAIERCKAFLILLSSHAIESRNVGNELSIASECDRTIFPIDLEPVILPGSFRYQLAGIQRTEFADHEGIVRALTKLGVATSISKISGGLERATESTAFVDSRKSLIVLPFEDLSPDQDNAWFADGLTTELIDSLGHIKSLRLIDRKTAMDLKGFRGKTVDIAKALQVRYFIEGTVRKFGDQIKISVSLLDIETGDYLWQESHKGKFEDIFEIQEAVAKKWSKVL